MFEVGWGVMRKVGSLLAPPAVYFASSRLTWWSLLAVGVLCLLLLDLQRRVSLALKRMDEFSTRLEKYKDDIEDLTTRVRKPTDDVGD